MQKHLLLLFALCFTLGLSAQNFVSTQVEKKKAVVEEFSGASCPFCPDGHVIIKDVLKRYPSEVLVITYHVTNSSLTLPRPGAQIDMRRSFANPFFSADYAADLFMPGAFVNRKKAGFPLKRMIGRSQWETNILNQLRSNASVNMGMRSQHDASNNKLVIDVEAYFTGNVNGELALYVYITESGLIAPQSGSSNPNYVHDHVFRETVTEGLWGDPISTDGKSGTLWSKQLEFDLSNTQDPIDISKAEVVAFLYNRTTEQIENGVQVHAENDQTSSSRILQLPQANMTISPNPASEFILVKINSEIHYSDLQLELIDLQGRNVKSHAINAIQGTTEQEIRVSDLPKGQYFIRLNGKDGQLQQRVVIQ